MFNIINTVFMSFVYDTLTIHLTTNLLQCLQIYFIFQNQGYKKNKVVVVFKSFLKNYWNKWLLPIYKIAMCVLQILIRFLCNHKIGNISQKILCKLRYKGTKHKIKKGSIFNKKNPLTSIRVSILLFCVGTCIQC